MIEPVKPFVANVPQVKKHDFFSKNSLFSFSLVKMQNHALTPRQSPDKAVEFDDDLLNSTVDIGNSGRRCYFGHVLERKTF